MESQIISVIVAIYNVEEYVDRCLETICNQTYRHLQIILVDDGSIDLSGTICEKWAEKDQRITCIHQPNKGLVCARKVGLGNAIGDYVIFVDGDDYLELDMIERMLHEAKVFDVDVVNCGFFINMECVGVPDFLFEITDTNRENFLAECIFDLHSPNRIYSSIWSKLFCLQVIKNAYYLVPDDCSVGEDLLAWINTANQNIRIKSINIPLYHYIKRGSSLMNRRDRLYYRKRLPFLCEIDRITNSFNHETKLADLVDKYMKHELMDALRKSLDDPFALRQYRLCDPDFYKGMRIILYGAGSMGCDLYPQFKQIENCNIIAWVDRDADILKDKLPVKGVEVLFEEDYDFVVLAIRECNIRCNITRDLRQNGISDEKIIGAQFEFIY